MGERPLLASDGATILVAEGAEVFAFDAGDDRELWRRDLGEAVVGVGANGLVLGRSGRLRRFDVATGRVLSTLATPMSDAIALAAEGSRAAVVSTLGVAHVERGVVQQRVHLQGATCAAYGPEGLAVGTASSLVLPGGRRVQLPGPARAVVWSGGWVVAAGTRIVRVGSRVDTLVDLRDMAVEDLAASPDGKVLAARVGQAVALFELQRRVLIGKVTWFETAPGGILLRAREPALIVAVGGGNANLIDVTSGTVRRTDPAADRPRGAWSLLPDLAPARVEAAPPPEPRRESGWVWWVTVLVGLGALIRAVMLLAE